jgi:DNA-binding response OmpR family regulator
METDTLSSAHPTLSILVVDDERDYADSIAMLLERWNHRVRVAYDGKQALEIFRDQRPDLVILDIALPGMDGYQLAVRLRAEERQAVLVALTGYSDRKRAIAAGFDEFYEKPLDSGVLRALISRVAAGRSAVGP